MAFFGWTVAVIADILPAWTAEEIRNVAKEARVVVADAYPADKLDEFTDALTPAFTRALPPKRNFAPAGEPTLVQQDVQREDEDS